MDVADVKSRRDFQDKIIGRITTKCSGFKNIFDKWASYNEMFVVYLLIIKDVLMFGTYVEHDYH